MRNAHSCAKPVVEPIIYPADTFANAKDGFVYFTRQIRGGIYYEELKNSINFKHGLGNYKLC